MGICLLFLLITSEYLSPISCLSHSSLPHLHLHLHENIESPLTKSHLTQLETLLDQFDKCEHIYLDIGTNIGVQIRKLFEPQKFPKALILPYFESFYGPASQRSSRVCAIGMEPNPKWTTKLSKLQSDYQQKGYNVIIFTETAANIHNKNLTFYTTPFEKVENNEWGSSLIAWDKRMIATTAGSISLSSLIQLIQYRKGKTENSVTFMKLDVEGAEFEILSDLIFSGSICFVKQITVEWHPTFRPEISPPKDLTTTINWLIKRKNNCPSELIELDDESYHNFGRKRRLR
jgi:FkbM family methyltransferase